MCILDEEKIYEISNRISDKNELKYIFDYFKNISLKNVCNKDISYFCKKIKNNQLLSKIGILLKILKDDKNIHSLLKSFYTHLKGILSMYSNNHKKDELKYLRKYVSIIYVFNNFINYINNYYSNNIKSILIISFESKEYNEFDMEIKNIYLTLKNDYNVYCYYVFKSVQLKNLNKYYNPSIIHIVGHGNVSSILLKNTSIRYGTLNKYLFFNLDILLLNFCYSSSFIKYCSINAKNIISYKDELIDDIAKDFAESFYQLLISNENIKGYFDKIIDEYNYILT